MKSINDANSDKRKNGTRPEDISIMKTMASIPKISIVQVFALLVVLVSNSYTQKSVVKPSPKLITLDPGASKSAEVLNGSPETVSMRSGYMVLAPTQSVGQHSTKGNEEALVILSGSGEMRMAGGPTLVLRRYSVAYCPPFTEHNVFNTGNDTLRYIYVVAKTAQSATSKQ